MASTRQRMILQAAIACALAASFAIAGPPPPTKWVDQKDGKLTYVTDERGNRVPDFSYAGYAAGARPIPTPPAKLTVSPSGADDTAAIQDAIAAVGAMPADADGLRGAVLLTPGEFKIGGSLRLDVNGVVLRGSGAGEGGTTLRATGTDRRTVIEIRGKARDIAPTTRPIADDYVPVNATRLALGDASGIAANDAVQITRPAPREWIDAIGMDDFGGDRHGPNWRPNSRDVVWRRTVTAVDGNAITIDAPITLAIDTAVGGGHVAKLDPSGIVRDVGVENLRIVSDHDPANPKDEDHAWYGVGIQHARDAWVRQVTFVGLAGGAVAAWETSGRVTVEDCQSLAPVSEIGGWRRRAFFTMGTQVLMQRLYSENAMHDFAVGLAAAGPNAFVQCESSGSLGPSGAVDSAASGTLFDRLKIDGQPLELRDRGYRGQGVGWASFNGVLWNSTAPLIALDKPPGANNWAFGTTGEFDGDGAWYGSADDVNPPSLYYAQLADRIGKEAAEARAQLNLPPEQGSRSTTPEQAARISEITKKPRVTMADWAAAARERTPIPTDPAGVPAFKRSASPSTDESAAQSATTMPARTLSIDNGWLTIGGDVVVGGTMDVPWWSGGLRPDDVRKAQPALTRFVPGRTGTGLTDDLAEVAEDMVEAGTVAVFQHPPLWYERRRDDHTRERRMDGDVVAPFYETPWARSGTGTAYDGLSKWDVTQANPWYFARLREFASIAADRQLLLFNGLYQQHNILEAGAHYADAPWRTANNINPVGLPEPVFYAGDKLIYIAEQFYDVTDKERAATHRAYMRAALEQLADAPNVVFYLSEEYTGPAEFTAFWLDVCAEWMAETGKRPLIGLNGTRDVVDTILSDPKRAAVVSVIFAPFEPGEGGKNLAPRQWQRQGRGRGDGKFEDVMALARSYRTKHPEKAFVYAGPKETAWAALLGGASVANLPKTTDAELLKAIAEMRPDENGLRDEAGNALVYTDVPPQGAQAIDMKTGHVAASADGAKVFWIRAGK